MKRLPTRRLITEMMARVDPQFDMLPDTKPYYWFRYSPGTLFHWQLVFGSSQKYRLYSASVAITALPIWDRTYGCHQLRCARPLQRFRPGPGACSAPEEWYTHDGTLQGAEATLESIRLDLKAYALPFFERFTTDAESDKLLQFGLAWIKSNLSKIPPEIASQIDDALEANSFVRAGARQPTMDELKAELRRYAERIRADKAQRREIIILAEDLLRYTGEVLLSNYGLDMADG